MKNCIQCGNGIKRGGIKYCSNKCQNKFQFLEKCKRIEKTREMVGLGVERDMRKVKAIRGTI